MERRLPVQFMLSALLAAGCGAEFDPPSEISGLRVLAVQKSEPYAAPGTEVTLRMLWTDEPRKGARPIQRAWLTGCFNPPGNLFFGCFEQLATGAFSPPAGEPPFTFGDEVSVQLPEDLISSRPAPAGANSPPFGTAFVFFAACAGELSPVLPDSERGFPLACLDADGEPLGSDDFVAGYSTIFSYAELSNENPQILGITVDGQEVAADCIGESCIGLAPTDGPPCPGLACIDRCEADGEESCPDIEVLPTLDPATFEVDGLAARRSGGPGPLEQMWVNYYVDRGGVSSPVRLVNDAETGLNEDYGTKLYAPKEPGPLRVWSAVHDNRGGVNWVRLTLQVR